MVVSITPYKLEEFSTVDARIPVHHFATLDGMGVIAHTGSDTPMSLLLLSGSDLSTVADVNLTTVDPNFKLTAMFVDGFGNTFQTSRSRGNSCVTPAGDIYVTAVDDGGALSQPVIAKFSSTGVFLDKTTLYAGEEELIYPVPWADNGVRVYYDQYYDEYDSSMSPISEELDFEYSGGTSGRVLIYTTPGKMGGLARFQGTGGFIQFIHPTQGWAEPLSGVSASDIVDATHDDTHIYFVRNVYPGMVQITQCDIATKALVVKNITLPILDDEFEGQFGYLGVYKSGNLATITIRDGVLSVVSNYSLDGPVANVILIHSTFADLEDAIPVKITSAAADAQPPAIADIGTHLIAAQMNTSLVAASYEKAVTEVDETSDETTFVGGVILPDMDTTSYTVTSSNPDFQVLAGVLGQSLIYVADDKTFSVEDDDPVTSTITASGGAEAGTVAFSIPLGIEPPPPGETYAPDRGPNVVEGTDLVDTAEMSGDYADYHVMYDSMAGQVVIMGPDGIDRFSGVEVFSFADGDKTLAEMISDASENTTDDLTSSPYHQVARASTDVPYEYYEITPDNSGLPKEVRYIRAGSDGVLDVLTNQGRAVSYTVSAGEVIFGYVVAVLDTTTVTNIVGYV